MIYGRRRIREALSWLDADAPPSDAERAAVLRLPKLIGTLVLLGWSGAAAAFCAWTAAEEVVNLFNAVFSEVVAAVKAEGGWVNKFEGDAALCVFGPPSGHADHAARALRAARQIRRGLDRIRRDHPELDAGIGMASGRVFAGNVGAADRYEYTVIGYSVNQAARITETESDQGCVQLCSAGIRGRSLVLAGRRARKPVSGALERAIEARTADRKLTECLPLWRTSADDSILGLRGRALRLLDREPRARLSLRIGEHERLRR